MQVSRIASRQRSKDNYHLTRRMSWKMAKTAFISSHGQPMSDETNLMLFLAISMAFCRLGSPVGRSLCRSAIDLSTSCGLPAARQTSLSTLGTIQEELPDISHMRSPTPARIPTTPIWPSGFWSNHSTMNSRAYCSVSVNRVGRMSRSSMDAERSSISTRCRIIDRRIAAPEPCCLMSHLVVGNYSSKSAYLRRLPLVIQSSTAPCKLPASSSWTVSHERVYEASQVYACYSRMTFHLLIRHKTRNTHIFCFCF